jgi:hypothetical protein
MWLPANARDELAQGRVAADVQAQRLVDHELQRQLDTVKRFNRDLRDIDPYLELVWIRRPRDWTHEGAPFGIVWNRWHVARHNPAAGDSYLPHVTADGGYREPDSGIFEMLRRSDLWRSDVQAKQRKRQARAAEARQRANDEMRAECREEAAMRLKALESPGVLFGGRGWASRAGKAAR